MTPWAVQIVLPYWVNTAICTYTKNTKNNCFYFTHNRYDNSHFHSQMAEKKQTCYVVTDCSWSNEMLYMNNNISRLPVTVFSLIWFQHKQKRRNGSLQDAYDTVQQCNNRHTHTHSWFILPSHCLSSFHSVFISQRSEIRAERNDGGLLCIASVCVWIPMRLFLFYKSYWEGLRVSSCTRKHQPPLQR